MEMLEEVMPKVLGTDSGGSRQVSVELGSPREPAAKRPASPSPDELRASESHTGPSPHNTEASEVLFCQDTMDALRQECPAATEFEVLLAGFLQKRLQKEIRSTGNEPLLQAKVDTAKGEEWETMLSKAATRVHKGAEAQRIRDKYPDRFVGSRFVVTNKVDEDGEHVKARWCLQGHLDPDVMSKVSSGMCHSPTMSQLSRSLLLQILVSKRWRMCLGDIKGAFLEAGPLKERYRPLFAHQPQGGIPGVEPNSVIEIIGNVYGLNDAPFEWWQAFDQEARALGFQRSQFDSCVYFFRCPESNALTGILGAHVDDSITGGEGAAYEHALSLLKKRFPTESGE